MKSIFNIFKHGLQKTKTTLVRGIQGIFSKQAGQPWTKETYDALEAALIGADLGVDISTKLLKDIRGRYERGEIETSADILRIAAADISQILAASQAAAKPLEFQQPGPTVILLLGVNGSGKTTTAAKLAHQFKSDGKSVALAACDTFRAAGVTQLQIWGERVGCWVIAGQKGGDAAAVAFDAVTAARKRNADVLIIDTAGRQHTRLSLMEELAKLRRTIAKAMPGAPHQVWLTVDASTGTNALIQAREFSRSCELTGLVLTKLDGSGKGGVVVPICKELGYPVRFIGLGEQLGDLQPFDPAFFARAIFEEE